MFSMKPPRKLRSPVGRIVREAAQHEEQAHEDRQLEEQRQAAADRVDAVLAVQRHHLGLQLLVVALVLRLQLLQLGRDLLHAAHRAHLDDRERQDREPHDDGQGDDRPGPRQSRDVLDAEEQAVERVLERAENVGERHVHRGVTGSTGSCREKGWQWLSRRSASSEPRSGAVRADRLLGVARAAGLEAARGRAAGHERVHDEAPERRSGASSSQSATRLTPALPAARAASSRTSASSQSEPLLGQRLGEARAGDDHEIDVGREARCARARTASRRSRLTRLRSTAPPTLRETVRPTRGSPRRRPGSRANA